MTLGLVVVFFIGVILGSNHTEDRAIRKKIIECRGKIYTVKEWGKDNLL